MGKYAKKASQWRSVRLLPCVGESAAEPTVAPLTMRRRPLPPVKFDIARDRLDEALECSGLGLK